MGNLFESLKAYFENTPKEVLNNDWKEIEYLNDIGPDVIEYAEYVKKYLTLTYCIQVLKRNCIHIGLTYL